MQDAGTQASSSASQSKAELAGSEELIQFFSASYAETLNIGQLSRRRPQFLAENLVVRLTKRAEPAPNDIPVLTNGSVVKEVKTFDVEGHVGMDVRVAQQTHKCLLGWMRARTKFKIADKLRQRTAKSFRKIQLLCCAVARGKRCHE